MKNIYFSQIYKTISEKESVEENEEFKELERM